MSLNPRRGDFRADHPFVFEIIARSKLTSNVRLFAGRLIAP